MLEYIDPEEKLVKEGESTGLKVPPTIQVDVKHIHDIHLIAVKDVDKPVSFIVFIYPNGVVEISRV